MVPAVTLLSTLYATGTKPRGERDARTTAVTVTGINVTRTLQLESHMSEAQSILEECMANITSSLVINGDVSNHPLLLVAAGRNNGFLLGAADALVHTPNNPANEWEDNMLTAASMILLAVVKRRLDDGKALADLPPVPTPSAWGGLAQIEFHTASN